MNIYIYISPLSQREPVQPRPHEQFPETASHTPLFLQSQRWEQPDPKRPAGHATHTHTPLSDVREHTHLPSQNTSSPSSPTHTPVTGSLLAPFPQTATRPQSRPKRPAGHAEHRHIQCLRHIQCVLLSVCCVWLTEMTAGPDESGRTLTGARDWKTNASVHTLTAPLAAGTVETLRTRYTTQHQ